MSVLDCWKNSYEMFVKDPNGEVTDFKIKLDVSFGAFEKLTLSEDTGEDIDKMVGKLKPIILGWENLVDNGGSVLCTEENKERILKMYWILEQVLYTYASIMSQYCKIKSIENDANDFMKNLKETYNIN